AQAYAIAHVGKFGDRTVIDLPRIDKGDDAIIAEAIARLDREFIDGTATDRIIVHVLWSQFLIAIAAHRSATARINAPRRRQIVACRSADRTHARARRYNDAVRNRIIA